MTTALLEPTAPVSGGGVHHREALRPLDLLPHVAHGLRFHRFSFESGGRAHEIATYRLNGPRGGGDPVRLGIFAGIHGDEPAGVMAAVNLVQRLVADPDLALGYEIWVTPLCNPTGYDLGTRSSARGVDLNREFWKGSAEPEVQYLEGLLRRLRFDGIISLHSDDTCDGLYGFASGATLSRDILDPALGEASERIPRDTRPVIDSFPAEGSIITDTYPGVLSAPPEASPRPFEIVFETPHAAPLGLQVQATSIAVSRILREYRSYIGQAINL